MLVCVCFPALARSGSLAPQALGLGDQYPLLAAILTQRPWDDVMNPDLGSLKEGSRGTADDAVLRAHAARYLPQIIQVGFFSRLDTSHIPFPFIIGSLSPRGALPADNTWYIFIPVGAPHRARCALSLCPDFCYYVLRQLLDQAPRPLLLLLKMQDCLRNIGRALGAKHNQHVATADMCLDVLARAELGIDTISTTLKKPQPPANSNSLRANNGGSTLSSSGSTSSSSQASGQAPPRVSQAAPESAARVLSRWALAKLRLRAYEAGEWWVHRR